MKYARNPISPATLRSLPFACSCLLLTSLQAVASAAMDAAAYDHATTLDHVEVMGNREAYRVRTTSAATKTDTPIRDLPQSLTVITDELISDQAMQGMADVVRYVPGVQMAQGEGHRDAPILRGNASTADFFVDGVRDDVQYFRDLYNVQQVEVLKGPSGMIFGRGGSGGLINRVTKQADGSGTRAIDLTFGTWGNRRLTGDYDQAVNAMTAFRITGLFEDSASYRDHGQVERRAVNPTFSVRTGDLAFAFGYEHFADDRNVDRGVPSFQGRPLPASPSTYFGRPDSSFARARVDALSSRISLNLDDATLVNHTRLADYDKFYQNVFPGAYTASTNQVAVSAYNNLTARRNLLNQTDLTLFAWTGRVGHELLVGVELNQQDTANFRQTGYFPAVGANATSAAVSLPDTLYRGPVSFRQSATDADNESVARTAALYVQDQIEFSPHWHAILGARYDHFEVDLRNHRSGGLLSSSDNLVSPRAGLIYKPREDLSIYASYTLAHVPRAGEQLASLTTSNRALEPEQFSNREVGLKWDIQGRMLATAALYQLNRTNVAITDPNNPALSLLVDGQSVQGLELGLAGRITVAWQLMAGYAWQDSEIRTPGVQNGNTLGQVPKHSLSIWNRYDFTPRWGVGLGASYRDEVFVATDNAVVLPGFTRFDAAVYYTPNSNMLVQLNVENLFDQTYFASAHGNNNILPGSPRAIRIVVGLDF